MTWYDSAEFELLRKAGVEGHFEEGRRGHYAQGFLMGDLM
eukprot:CAMPEP_0185753380 /NCGR_PEP_ID=MMETSP1174-20130828/12089_1 /TAXON_ID=35687 /ORGANISM="Dictyocha speculum, Strain CCMP1381" /LENGTH=39 /DNA_ID= /DNA_START= /DNA_END= /DNA_ORIENTATION=